ncbi:aquaporin-like protein [Staphylotrichum tortipilum]|uniref:Aquaporin-like protein n=1 Tax=Staphylotrichum tortipilum TaxID=2831512 RepID=A0AAN6MJV3_9PEZI|nr:aquaporin-like protein [Staphylotrichum longicolle]
MSAFRRHSMFSFASDAGHSSPQKGRLPMLSNPSTLTNNIVAGLGEFVGTFLFLFLAFAGTQIANTPAPTAPAGSAFPLPNTSNLMFIAVVFGFSLMANVWAFYRVALALFLVGGLPLARTLVVILAEFLGGICAAAVASACFPGAMTVATTLGGGTSISRGLFIEMFLTTELVFVIIMLAAEKHKSTYLAPIGIGIAFFVAELSGVYFTGGSLNPARSLGPAVVNHSFPGYFWIYWVGPLLGSLLASGFYSILKYLRWKECNPGQDWNDIEKQEAKQRSFNDGKASHPAGQGPVTNGAINGNDDDVDPRTTV